MEECKERILKRIKSQYKAVVVTSLIFWIFASIIAFIPGEFEPGIVIFLFFSIVMLIVALPMLIKYKKSMDVITNTSPTVCTVVKSGMKFISSKRLHQAAYFIYEGKECYGLDYDKQLNEIEAGQQLYVWKITDKRYEITHVG